MKRWATGALLGLAVFSLQWVVPPFHDFPEPKPFSGAALINPYQDVSTPFRKAALHLHGTAWAGLTSGAQPQAQLVAQYRDAGYAWVGLTDYMRIEPHEGDGRGYEHGLNFKKTHQLVLGAEHVVYFDQLWPTRNGRQFVLDWLRLSARAVAISHPLLGGGYSQPDLERLDGYDLIEVASHVNRFTAGWESALSSGHRVYAVAGDDSHDTAKESFSAWLMVASASEREADVLDALKAGRSYAVHQRTPGAEADLALKSLRVDGDVLTVEFDRLAWGVRFIGQNGQWMSTEDHVDKASYTFKPSDPYIRVEAVSGVDHPTTVTLFTNPVTRSEGAAPVRIAWVPTLLSWFGWLALVGLALRWVRRAK